MRIRLEPVTIGGLEEGEGLLAYCDDQLVAVLVRLGKDQGESTGCWFVEKAFGPLDRPQHPLLSDAGAVQRWLASEMADHTAGSPFDRRKG